VTVLTRYIVTAVLKSTGITLLLLLTLFNLFAFGDELDDIGKGNYGLTEALYFIAYTSPTVLYQLMPASALVGGLFALGAMANRHELNAMRTAGLSILGIIKATLMAGLILAAFALLVGELVAPETEQKAHMFRVFSQKGQVVLRTRYGLWLREGKEFINIRTIDSNGDLLGVNLYELDDNHLLKQSTYAEKAVFQGDRGWVLHQVKRSYLSTSHITANRVPEQLWPSSMGSDFFKMAVINPNNLSFYDLAMYIEFLKKNHQKSHLYEKALWGRVANPLAIFVMLLVSVPFVIGIGRETGVGGKILIGTIVGLGFNIFDMTTGQIGLIYGLNPAVIAFLPSLLVSVLAFFAIRRLG